MWGAAKAVAAVLAAVASLAAGGGALPATLPSGRNQLVADLDRAQQIIDSPNSSSADLRAAGRFEQLASALIDAQPRHVQRALLDRLSVGAAATIRADLAAAGALSHLDTPHRSLPPWRILEPPAPTTLLGYFRAAQARFGVRWQYLAAIELIETRFGRVAGLSSAGAEGPMQFMPATWAAYGSGDVHNPRDAIFGAARYLVANGAPRDMADAIYHYNPSSDYVAAVERYAARMLADPRAYYGYYFWRVIYDKLGGPVILPVGFPRARPLALGPLLG